jgi:prephenate dehydrogenase
MSDTVAIIGLGLIGGSLARDLHQRGITVLGRDTDRNTEIAALNEGVIHATNGLADARCIVIATPVSDSIDTLERIAPHTKHAELITDTGSTKRRIQAAALQLGIGARFVGSHPLAGDHRAVWSAARTGLFAAARVYVCGTHQSSSAALAAADSLWRQCGAQPIAMNAGDHDALLAHTSHLPQIISTALALVLDGADVDVAQLGPGGRDMVRLAASSPRLWRDVLCDNRDNVVAALQDLQSQLATLEQVLTAADGAVIEKMLERARAWRGT